MSTAGPIRSIAIVGGGTSGWIAAAMLARALSGAGLRITVIEAPDIATVGVGEATIPPIIDLLRFLSINETDFARNTQATYKLGIRFEGWNGPDHVYWHPFGSFGVPVNRRPFYQTFLKARAEGADVRVDAFSACAALGNAGRFAFPDPRGNAAAGGLKYALHFDAGLVAKYLKAYSLALGVSLVERKVVATSLDARGFIGHVQFDGGDTLEADLFIDCSGFRGLLIEQALHTGYVDWRDYLPCDRAVAAPTLTAQPRAPYTRAVAQTAGWRWRIPLRHRTGNGYVYASGFTSDEAALAEFAAATGDEVQDARVLSFVTGRRKTFWNGNCIAVGLASGFLEPLESTSIHLVVSAIYNLLDHFPDRDFEPRNIARYNRELIEAYEQIRDFIILHYCLTQRSDSDFWRHCANLTLPDSLSERIAYYAQNGRLLTEPRELFTDLSWFYVFEGMGLSPARRDPLMDILKAGQLQAILRQVSAEVDSTVSSAQPNDRFFNDAVA